jgi:hypothetical protein
MKFHDHIRNRMRRRGVSEAEVEHTLRHGWQCGDAAGGRDCRTFVFALEAVYDGRWYAEKEVTVYYTQQAGETILVTVKSRYGSGFPRG